MEKLINKERVGNRMKSARIAAGLSQTDVANKLGINVHTVCNWELRPDIVTFGKLEKFAEVCGVPLSYFFT